ncbi:hypothetical protein HDU98_011346 [Podochytrium sp. JEL0797]|nr:hypothetical protein HDU98_011346 [Podochytrium sp. JEL0797]
MGIGTASFYSSSAAPREPMARLPMLHGKVSKTYSRMKPRSSLPLAPPLAATPTPRAKPFTPRKHPPARTTHTKHTKRAPRTTRNSRPSGPPRVVAHIDLTGDAPVVIDLTRDDTDTALSAAAKVVFPLTDLPVAKLNQALDAQRTQSLSLEAFVSLISLFTNSTARSSRLKLRKSSPPSTAPFQKRSTTLTKPSESETLQSRIKATFAQTSQSPLTEISSNPVTPELITSMIRPTTWLSDEAINAYIAALQIAFPRIKFFNTFFYSLLGSNKRVKEGYDYESVRRWTKRQTKAGIFEFERIAIPINKGNTHWCFAFICLRTFKITFLDSLPGSTVYANRVLSHLKRYLQDEWLHKVIPSKTQPPPNIPAIETFELVNRVPGCPKQTDGNSCGVFVCYFAFCVARGENVCEHSFGQWEADLFRRGVAHVITLPVLLALGFVV